MTAPAPTGVNEDLLRRVLEHITAHPEEHDQSWWATRTADCGTVACIAGHTCLAAGLTIDLDTPDEFGLFGNKLIDRRRVSDVAAELLGLDREQQFRLFHDSDDLHECWAYARVLSNGRIRPNADQRRALATTPTK